MKLRILAISLVSVPALCACKITPRYSNEGTAGSPVAITVGVPHQGTVGQSGGNYTIALTNTHTDLSWEVYNTSWNLLQDCDNVWFAAGDEIKVVALAVGTYYLTVTEYLNRDSTFTLEVY